MYSHQYNQQLIKGLNQQTILSINSTNNIQINQINPRSSYQQQHSSYFSKLQQQLLQKSNRYTSIIGKKVFPKQLSTNSYNNNNNTVTNNNNYDLQYNHHNLNNHHIINHHQNNNQINNQINNHVNNQSIINNINNYNPINNQQSNHHLNNNNYSQSNNFSTNNILHKISQIKNINKIHQQSHHHINNPTFIQINQKNYSKPSKNNSTTHLLTHPTNNHHTVANNKKSINNFPNNKNSINDNYLSNNYKSKTSQHLLQSHIQTQQFTNKNSFHTLIHAQLDSLQPKTCLSRQQTQRTQHQQNQPLRKQQQQKNLTHQYQPISTTQNLVFKLHRIPCNKSTQLANKIDHIKQVINNFNNSKKAKPKQINQKQKQNPLELHRKLVYNLTYQDSNPSILQDSPPVSPTLSPMKQSRGRNHLQTQNILSKLSNDNLGSTISTKISLNHNSNETSKVSLFKKQNDLFQNQPFQLQKQKQSSSINITKTSNIHNLNVITKIAPKLQNRISQKQFKSQKISSISDFIILAEIGQGKAGTVYMAKHIESNFLCALKVINRQILNQNVIIQLIREIQIQFYLDHPNIVQLYAFFSDCDHIYLMLELCFSGNLYTHLRRQKILSQNQIKPIIKQVCYALQFMHDNQIIHRDLKPQNILFHENVVKICDLGWAVYSPLPRDTLCGTPIYASPELVQKKKYNSKIDVWNVGVMTYELLCGRVPFQIRSEQDLYKVVIQQIHFPKSIAVSQFCKDFINCCLSKKPQNRKTITELLLHSFLNDG